MASLPAPGQHLCVSGSRSVCLVRRLGGFGYCFCSSPLAPEFGKRQPFSVTAHFSRPAFLIPAISVWFTWVPPQRSGKPGGKGKRPAALRRGAPRPSCRAPGAPRPKLAPAPAARPPDLLPPTSLSARGSGSFENPLTPAVTPLGEVASPGSTQSAGKPEAVPRLKAKGPFISRAPESNWSFVH